MRTKRGPSVAAMLGVLMIGVVVGISFIAQPCSVNGPSARSTRMAGVHRKQPSHDRGGPFAIGTLISRIAAQAGSRSLPRGHAA
jgi:hypothetical protein